MSTYSYSVDEESYDGEFDTRDEAIAEAFATYPQHDTVFTGLNVHFEPDYTYAAQAALEQLICQAEDECGEHAESWNPYYNTAIMQRVTQTIKQAIEELDPPGFFSVSDVEQHWREE